MSAPRVKPIAKKCPVCGSEDWGLTVHGDFGNCWYVASCYPKGHERPVVTF